MMKSALLVSRLSDFLTGPVQHLTCLDFRKRSHVLLALVFAVFVIDLWSLFHWRLWELKIEAFHLALYTGSFIIISFLLSRRFSERFTAFDQLWEKCVRHTKPILALMCVTHLAIAIFLLVFFLDRIPHVSDGIFYLFQAKTFSLGRLSLPIPKYAPFLAMNQILMHNGQWFTIYPPGWPFLLMFGVFAGKPWLVNPLFSTALIFVVYFCGRELYGKGTGLLAAGLATASPFLMCFSVSFLSHTGSTLFCTLYLFGILKALRRDSLHWYLLAGSCLGASFLIRPYTAVVFGAPGVIYLLFVSAKKGEYRFFKRATFLLAPIIVAACILVWHNSQMTGDWFKLGYNLKHGPLNNPGFGERRISEQSGFGTTDVPAPQRHTPLRGLMILQSYGASVNFWLFGWPIPSLIFLIPWFLCANSSKYEKVMLASVGGLAFGYFLYYYREKRLIMESLPWMILMTARGIDLANEKWKKIKAGRTGVPFVVTACMLYTLLLFYPFKLIPSLPSRTWINTNLPKLVREENIHNAVVFIDSESGEENYVPGFVAHQSYLWNELNPEEGDVLYLRDLGDRNKQLRALEQNRSFWRYSYNPGLKRGELVPLDP